MSNNKQILPVTQRAIPKPKNRTPTVIFKMPIEEEVNGDNKPGRYSIVMPKKK